MRVTRKRAIGVRRNPTQRIYAVTVGLMADSARTVKLTQWEIDHMIPLWREFGYRVYDIMDCGSGETRLDLVPLEMR